MTDIEKALTEALHSLFPSRGSWRWWKWSGASGSDVTGLSPDFAAAILATPQMQAIARHAAIGEAVERASDEYLVVRRLPSLGPHYPAAWQVWREDADGLDYPTHTRSTLGDALAAALGEDDR